MPFRIATYLWLGLTLAFIAAPTAIAVIVAFSVDEVVKFPPDGLSIKWFAIAWRQELFWRSALISMSLAFAAMVIAVPVGVAGALAIRRSSWRVRQTLELLFMAPLLVPAIVLSLAILVGSVMIGSSDAPLRLWAAHTVILLPYVVRTTLASLSGMPPYPVVVMTFVCARTIAGEPNMPALIEATLSKLRLVSLGPTD